MPDELTGTADAAPVADSGADPSTTPAADVQTQADQAAPPQEDSFLDDAEIMQQVRQDERLNRIFNKMNSAYTKRSQALKSVQQAADLVSKFDTDDDFAKQVIRQRASQLGMKLDGAPKAEQPTGSASEQAPRELVERIKAKLPAELQWMAQSQADIVWEANRAMLEPLKQQQQERELANRREQLDALETEMGEKFPGWEEHQDDMDELLSFMRGPSLRHRKFGQKYEVLYKMVAGEGLARAEAARRLANGAKSGVLSGQVSKPQVSNATERIRGAKNDREAWKIAGEVAQQEARKLGLNV